ncbi:hypothetical protein BDN72DRAFT_848065 [Pluteus cervinus]|uniref:Uncharacterized protein n=1 Tax=Pluteus cervinus TaxID=181527 RepID=A0ACD3ABL5_9AGAR|nr:hypothetical protein BDN72DRAFT_848065 [Pluteus cervinus]
MATKDLRVQLGLNTARKDKEWKDLINYIGERIKEYMDLSPDSIPPTQQNGALERLTKRITEDENSYFSGKEKEKALRKYLIMRIGNERHSARRKDTGGASASQSGSRAQSLDTRLGLGTPRSFRTVGGSPPTSSRAPRATPYPTRHVQPQDGTRGPDSSTDEHDLGQSHRSASIASPTLVLSGGRTNLRTRTNYIRGSPFPSGVHVENERIDAVPFSDDDEIALRPTRHDPIVNQLSASRSLLRQLTSRPPLQDLDPSDPRLNPSFDDQEPMEYTKRFHVRNGRPHMAIKGAEKKEEDENQIPTRARPRRDTTDGELVEFLNTCCQDPLPHLLPHLRAYGCEDMKRLKMIATWPLTMILNITAQLRDRSAAHRRASRIKDMDWDLLAYAIWSLEGEGEG